MMRAYCWHKMGEAPAPPKDRLRCIGCNDDKFHVFVDQAPERCRICMFRVQKSPKVGDRLNQYSMIPKYSVRGGSAIQLSLSQSACDSLMTLTYERICA